MKRRRVLQYLGAAAVAAVGPKGGFAEAMDLAAGFDDDSAGFFFNQLGYMPGRAKVATVRSKAWKQDAFRVRAMDGAVVFQGTLGSPVQDAASGDLVRLADFSAVKASGMYRVEVDGQLSDPLAVRGDVYAEALRLTMRAYYGQRCGCAVDMGGGYQHPACHADGAYHRSSGKTGKVANHGGWHDAGDYGRYVVNSGITTGTLLWAWEMYPEVLRGLGLGIPESGQKTPDYLAEVRWNLEWMLSLQDADGGVFHKQTSEQFCGFVMPQDDHMTSYIIGVDAEPYKSTCATGDLAAVMAIAARCYGPFDAAFAQRCLEAARKGWEWAVAHPDVVFENPKGVGTGGYGDKHCGDEILWASAELWRTTGEAKYEQAFLQALPAGFVGVKVDAPGWGDVSSMAYWTYFLSARPGSAEVKRGIREATLKGADELVARSGVSGYGNTMESRDYVWGSNAVAANQSLLLWVADRMKPSGAYVEAALNNLHYLVGRNCLGVSWVTQVGTRPFMHPHHRPSAADGIEKPWPGMLSGGPNAGGGDSVANKLPKQPPMRMWVDDQRAYSLNEIAINWNAPLVFLLAAANAKS